MANKKRLPKAGVSPVSDAIGFLALVARTRPLFRRGAKLADQYEALGLRAQGEFLTSGEVVDELYRRMKRDLDATVASEEDLLALQRHLRLRQVLDGLDCDDAINLVTILKDATREEGWPCPSLDSPRWPNALRWARTCFEAIGRPLYFPGSRDPRVLGVGLAARELRNAGYRVQVLGTRIDTTACDREVLADLDRLASTIGGLELAEAIFGELRPKLDRVQNRYHLVRRPESKTFVQQEPSIPYGYLLSLAIKHVASSNRGGGKSDYDDLKRIATAYAAMYDVEPYYASDGRFNDRDSIVRYLQDTAAFDALFTFPQCNPNYVPELLLELFGLISEADVRRALGTDLDTLAAVAGALLADRPQGPLLFTVADIAARASLPTQGVRVALKCLTHDNNPNASLSDPIAIDSARFWEFPLLDINGEFMLLDAAYCAPAFYEAVLARLRVAGVPQLDNKVGLAFEQFALKSLRRHGLDAHSGRYRSSIGDGECDAVVETTEAIVFLEFKKKCLTRKARSAQSDAIVADLTHAMLEPHCQTGRHELALLSDGLLELSTSVTSHIVELGGRKIERLAISLPEFGAFHSREITSQVLSLLTGAIVSSPTLSVDVAKKINQACALLGRQYALAVQLNAPKPGRYFNCWFLGIDALLTLLENVTDGDSFWRELRRTRNLSTGSLSWHFDYYWARGMDPKLADIFDSMETTIVVQP